MATIARRFLEHPSEKALERFVRRELVDPAASAIRMHIRRCPKCRSFVMDLRALAAKPKGTPKGRVKPPERLMRRIRKLAKER